MILLHFMIPLLSNTSSIFHTNISTVFYTKSTKKNYVLHTCTILVQRYSPLKGVNMQLPHIPCCLQFVQHISLVLQLTYWRKWGCTITAISLSFDEPAGASSFPFFSAPLVISHYRLKHAIPLYSLACYSILAPFTF
jgi:hypothetical protein